MVEGIGIRIHTKAGAVFLYPGKFEYVFQPEVPEDCAEFRNKFLKFTIPKDATDYCFLENLRLNLQKYNGYVQRIRNRRNNERLKTEQNLISKLGCYNKDGNLCYLNQRNMTQLEVKGPDNIRVRLDNLSLDDFKKVANVLGVNIKEESHEQV